MRIEDENGFIYERYINIKKINDYIDFIKYNTNFYEVEVEPKELKIIDDSKDSDKTIKVFRL